ncbi:hypothetical protein Bca101_017159 [Brassica carinata]
MEVGLAGDYAAAAEDVTLDHPEYFGACPDGTCGGSALAAAVENAPHDLEVGLVSDYPEGSVMGMSKKAVDASHQVKRERVEMSMQNRAQPAKIEVTATASGGFAIELDEVVQVVGDLSTLLKVDLERGIDDELPQRRQTFVSNTYPCKKGNTFWSFIWKASKFPPSLVMLLAAVIISLLKINGKAIHGGWYVEACVILATVLDIIVRAITEYKQFRQFEKLSEEKRNIDPEVTSAGINTVCGLTMEFPHETDEEKPVQAYLKWITASTSWVVVSFASIASIVQLGRYFSGWTKKSDGTPMFILGDTTADEATDYLIKSLNFWVATIVVSVPVGLPMAILLNLANTTRKMVKDNALVLTHSALERMGSVTTILCQKTGTLTSDQASGLFYMLLQNLVLLTIIGFIKDPCQPRPGTMAAIQLCRSGGVKVCMVTDDDVLTARAVAKDCGILEDSFGHNIMTGAQFRALSDLDREEMAPKILVYAESSPSDRLLLVKALKKGGHVFAAIGMGIHDPTSLHADVSIAMGTRGTEAAKENFNIVILDDDFATIVKVILWSRSLHTNIQRYVVFRLTVSVSTLAICAVEVVFYDAFPFIPLQLLSLNLIVDIFGSLALAYKPTGNHLLGKPAVGIRDPLMTRTMWSRLIIQVIYVVLFLVLINSDKLLKLVHGDTGKSFVQIIVFEFLGIFVSAVKLDWKVWLLSVVVGLLRFCS